MVLEQCVMNSKWYWVVQTLPPITKDPQGPLSGLAHEIVGLLGQKHKEGSLYQ